MVGFTSPVTTDLHGRRVRCGSFFAAAHLQYDGANAFSDLGEVTSLMRTQRERAAQEPHDMGDIRMYVATLFASLRGRSLRPPKGT